jgi:hypothetical protein
MHLFGRSISNTGSPVLDWFVLHWLSIDLTHWLWDMQQPEWMQKAGRSVEALYDRLDPAHRRVIGHILEFLRELDPEKTKVRCS